MVSVSAPGVQMEPPDKSCCFFSFSLLLSGLVPSFLYSFSLSLCLYPAVQIRVGDVNDVQLVQLIPNTAYTISLYALHGEAASDALVDQGVTCMCILSQRANGSHSSS